MNLTSTDINELLLKRDDAISSVKRNLRKYADMKRFPEDFLDRVSSFTSSLITVNNDDAGISNPDLKLVRGLIREEQDKAFESKYDYILTCLCPESNQYIIRIYFNNERLIVIKDEENNIYTLLKDAYEIIACLDDEIEYSIEDYSQFRQYELEKNKNPRWNIKKLSLDYLNKAKRGFMKDKVVKSLKQLPTEEKEALIQYISSNEKNYSSYEYRKIKRGLLLFAYYFEDINFSFEDLENEMSKTGGGWKVKKGAKGTPIEFWSYYNIMTKKTISIPKMISLIAENSDNKEIIKPISHVYNVFNGEVIEGIDEYQLPLNNIDVTIVKRIKY